MGQPNCLSVVEMAARRTFKHEADKESVEANWARWFATSTSVGAVGGTLFLTHQANHLAQWLA